MKPALHAEGPETRVVPLGKPVEVLWVVTIKNTGPGNLPAGRAELVLSNATFSAPLTLVSVVSSPDGQHGTISVHSRDFLKYHLPAIRRGSTVSLVIGTWTRLASRESDHTRLQISAHVRDLAPSEQPGVAEVVQPGDVASVGLIVQG